MRKIIAILSLVILFISFASAEIIITQQPNEVYNLGEVITIPITVKSLIDISSIFDMNIICQGQELNFYKNGIRLAVGEQKNIEASLILTKKMIGEMKGDCIMKAILGTDYVLTNKFKISDQISINSQIKNPEINPGEIIIIEGTTTKESKSEVNGFIKAEIFQEGVYEKEPINKLGTIDNNLFSISLPTPENMKSGNYKIKLYAYERDSSEEVSNRGLSETSFFVKQLPKNLEIIIDNPDIEPGTSLKLKTILHDQTGDNIPANSTITIKNSEDKLLEKSEIITNQPFELPISYKEFPGEFEIIAESSGLTSEKSYNVKTKEDIKIEMTNQTILVTNIGNVPYCNKTILIKIGEERMNIQPCLQVGKEQKYTLTAPDGQYQVEIMTDNQKLSENVALTGKTVAITAGSTGISTLTRHPFIWVFVIGIMGFFVTMIWRKGYKKGVIGYVHKKRTSATPVKESEETAPKKVQVMDFKTDTYKAELSLSIKGDNQNVSLICLKIKNFKEVQSNAESVKETMHKVIQIAKDNKGLIYQNEGNFFFIFAPIRTRTFQNEKTAVDVSTKIKETLSYHNRFFRQKIEFGLSLNYGEIVANAGKEKVEFMAMGDLMIKAKRIASISPGDVFLEEKLRNRLGAEIKTEKVVIDGVPAYRITDIKDTKEHEKFIKSFLSRVDK